MRRDKRLRSRGHNVLRNADGKRRTFAGVRPRAELVEQHQRTGGDFAEYADYVFDMRRKGGQALFYALFVAYVGIDSVHDGDFGGFGGKIKPAERHTHKQSRHFQRHGLAARIRPRNEQHFLVGFHCESERHDFFCVDERMSSLFHGKLAFRVQLRAHRLHFVRKLRSCKHGVHLDYGGVACFQPVRMSTDGRREIAQNALYLRLFIELFRFQLVVELDDLHRLDVKRRTGCGLVVHKSAYRALELAFYGNDVTVAAHGDNAVLQIFVISRRGDESLQLRLHAVAESAYAYAYRTKFGILRATRSALPTRSSSGMDSTAPFSALVSVSSMSSTAKEGDTENSNSTLSASAVISSAFSASPIASAGRSARQAALPPSDCA